MDAEQHPRGADGIRLPGTSEEKASDGQHRGAAQPLDKDKDAAYQRIPKPGLATPARLGHLYGNQ